MHSCRACPYILSPPQCGHTYCAICILLWFFSSVCDHCQAWCEELACPLCRTSLPQVPNEVPRPMFALPFTPARAANERITFLIDSLGGPMPDPSAPVNGHAKGQSVESPTSSTGWERGGHLRTEWEERDGCVITIHHTQPPTVHHTYAHLTLGRSIDRRGRTEMQAIIRGWPLLTPRMLIILKRRLRRSFS